MKKRWMGSNLYHSPLLCSQEYFRTLDPLIQPWGRLIQCRSNLVNRLYDYARLPSSHFPQTGFCCKGYLLYIPALVTLIIYFIIHIPQPSSPLTPTMSQRYERDKYGDVCNVM